jgi:histidinol dehydrogenase
MWKVVEVDAWIASRKSSLEDVRATVSGIIDRVQNEGDEALRALAKKHCDLTDIAVSGEA